MSDPFGGPHRRPEARLGARRSERTAPGSRRTPPGSVPAAGVPAGRIARLRPATDRSAAVVAAGRASSGGTNGLAIAGVRARAAVAVHHRLDCSGSSSGSSRSVRSSARTSGGRGLAIAGIVLGIVGIVAHDRSHRARRVRQGRGRARAGSGRGRRRRGRRTARSSAAGVPRPRSRSPTTARKPSTYVITWSSRRRGEHGRDRCVRRRARRSPVETVDPDGPAVGATSPSGDVRCDVTYVQSIREHRRIEDRMTPSRRHRRAAVGEPTLPAVARVPARRARHRHVPLRRGARGRRGLLGHAGRRPGRLDRASGTRSASGSCRSRSGSSAAS